MSTLKITREQLTDQASRIRKDRGGEEQQVIKKTADRGKKEEIQLTRLMEKGRGKMDHK